MDITPQSKSLFIAYANDADNWGGEPLVGGTVKSNNPKEDRGNLTQLKRAGLIETFTDDNGTWIRFTDAGRAYAKTLGVEYFQ